MTHPLTIIIPMYNAADYIESCVASIIHQTSQDFEVIVVNDGSTDESERLLMTSLEHYHKSVRVITLNQNKGHAYARNVGMSHVETPYLMFLDADDTLSPYTIETYLSSLDHEDLLFAPISPFTVEPSTRFDATTLTYDHLTDDERVAPLLKHRAISNIIFKTSIIQEYGLAFNTDLSIYVDWSFLIDYINLTHTATKLSGIAFYYKGEVFDPFYGSKLTARQFDETFSDYIAAFYDALARSNNDAVRHVILQEMLDKIYKAFDPSHRDIKARYQAFHEVLSQIIPLLKPVMNYRQKLLFKLELLSLKWQYVPLAWFLNKYRYRSRLLKNIALNKPSKHYSKYMLYNSTRAVKPKTVLFESFGGKSFNDSPQAIYDYMKTHYPDYHYYWILQDVNHPSLPDDVHVIKKGSKAYYNLFKTAQVWVTNARLPLYLKKKPNQLYIQTWHGTPLKRLANDMKQVRLPNTTTPKYKRNFYRATQRWDFLISPNAYSTDIFQSAFWMQRDQILEIGYPRNDILVNHQDDADYIQSLKSSLGIPSHKRVVLYAPTWRDDEYIEAGAYTFDLKIDLAQMQQALGKNTVVLLRMHYLIANQLDLSGYEGFAYDVSNYQNVSELYLMSDCLITDYSSVMFDYGILKRPQLFFAYDIDKYANDLRGFYIDYHEDLPGPIYTDASSLIHGLKDLDLLQQQYQPKIDRFYERFCTTENGQASKYIGDMIHNYIETQH
ncbi:CDP-glycerol:glycerophosphate glycerophosphotransferase [Staphylococcus felis]|uniref:CDP-glycerol:glycerophosphate glycerophosphotransferase n=2 Tax=Staphylococcus felis TaxID=46127 RepID=A0AAX1RZQ8_9STAP|nr:bifunctional glycosyltransferase family 2 protein/CDP-glycerol:glycerophosphate glycerophosphotransferase [Staphylococcus felis]REH75523.1 CDP-glycerol:glycerophosphate glycerophosphotransferase [Staphylococcus felis]REH76051.1 CDP-glycerol:glycerophosphate glycerophosphotransferase [Staphylococcus felis]REH86050.1 CDP-glycerol:glycerophosphate glycerophosphotransferase [Staphylococcus felis]REH86057.1 CDP-glycerol:glycerophosphate glycerophosphotransferase [Staphylococcus felis]REH91345.1 